MLMWVYIRKIEEIIYVPESIKEYEKKCFYDMYLADTVGVRRMQG